MILRWSIFKKLKYVPSLIRTAFFDAESHRTGIFVQGARRFRERVLFSLDFLAESPEICLFIKTNIKVIWQSAVMMIVPIHNRPTFLLNSSYVDKPIGVVAGAILRAAYRLNLYREYQKNNMRRAPRSIWSSREAKQAATKFAIEKLRIIGVSQETLDILQKDFCE